MLFVTLIVALCVAVAAVAKKEKNAAKSTAVDAILASLTLEEKIGQMVQIDISVFMESGTDIVDYAKMKQWVDDYKIGSILNNPFSGGPINGVVGWNASKTREMIINMQEIAQSTPSKIPIIYGLDSIHGANYIKDAALFPQAIAAAASFDPEMAYNFGKVTSKDTRAGGIQWLFAPVLGLGLHPLWARFSETFGEDPYLAAQMGKAVIDGIQYSEDAATNKRHLRADATVDESAGIPAKAAACMKHFIAYSFPVNGHDRSPVMLPDRTLRQLYMPQFQAAIDTGVMTAMESYQEVGGDPMVSSESYLKTLLRKEMKFQGMMVTDYMEIENLHKWHKVSATEQDAVLLSMTDTTIDMSMVPVDSTFGEYLSVLVASGQLNTSRIEDSARRVIQLKYDLGMFDTENLVFSPEDPLIATVGSAQDWELSLNGSRAAITLLKNHHFQGTAPAPVLPIATPATANVFLTGPTANSVTSQTGGWSVHWQGMQNDSEVPEGVSVLHGMKNFNLFGDGSRVSYTPGVSLLATDTSALNVTEIALLASAADVIVVCVGEGTYEEKPGDIDDLALPQGQIEYVQLLATYGKPIVLVQIQGRPRLMHVAVASADAVINAYQPGPKGGLAIAEALAGVLVPSGRIPFSYPRHAGDIPYAYHHKPGDQCVNATNGAYITCQMEWEFGTGLSYTTFAYSDLTLTAVPANANADAKMVNKEVSAGGSLMAIPSLSEEDSLQVSLTVTNTGAKYTAADSVLLFLFDVYRRVTPEYKLLKRFSKVLLAPGQSTTLTWTLDREDLKYVGIDSRYILESGEFRLGAGPQTDCRLDSWTENPLCASFELQLSQAYQPVCDYACAMWSPDSDNAYVNPGICGNTVDATTCRSTCVKQAWSWNYVDCIEQYYQENTCTNAYQMQCFDAFNMAPVDTSNKEGDEDCSDLTAQPWFFALITLLVAAVCLVLGALLVSYGVFSCKKSKPSVAGVDPSNFLENQNPIRS